MIYRVKVKCIIDDTYEIEANSADDALGEAAEWANDDFLGSTDYQLVDEDGCPIEE